ncbi:MAG: hypothetical protein A4E58_01302 [Syntrophorhabdus sp. PtaB.Bin006]|nr:MAG: hypothetical protein A4E58_01302 [Syntrophorhabdus sp. PtaB.Bin006]
MAKVHMTCPFSKGPCVECSVFRGRHYYFCFLKGRRGTTVDPAQFRKELAAEIHVDAKFGMPNPTDVPVCSTAIKDVEQLVERREG